MNGPDDMDLDVAVAQNVKVHARAARESGLLDSDISAWHIEFLRPGEFKTFTDLKRAWAFVKAVNAELGMNFFKLLVDAAHMGNSGLSIPENQSLITEIAEAGHMGIYHASAPTTRGCLSTDDGWIGSTLLAASKTGKLDTVFIELFDHRDPALEALRKLDAGHGIDTRDGRTYTQTAIDALVETAHRLNNLAERGYPLKPTDMRTLFHFVIPLLLLSGSAHGEDSINANGQKGPKVEKLDDDSYRIGDVTLNKSTREIRFPAMVNMREGLLEYLIVHQNGKIHESLFRTGTSPTNLNVAFALLSYKPSKELYRIPKEPGVLSGNFYQEPEETKLAARIVIDVEVERDGETKRYPVSDWIRHEATAKAMPPTFWIYGGSEFYDGKFVPESTGDIAAIFVTNSSLINYPGEDNLNDEVWTCFSTRVPEVETKVTLVIAPYGENP